MARRVLLLPLGVLALAIYVGCGLTTLSGELASDPDGGEVTPNGDRHSASDGSSNSSGGNGGGGGAEIDAGPPPPTCQTDACALPQGGVDFGVVLYGDRSTACPAGFDPTDLQEGPKAAAGACTCGTCAVSGVDCNQGTLPSRYDSDNQCSNIGVNLNANGGNCRNQSASWTQWGSVLSPQPIGGSCASAASTANKGLVTTTGVRICTPQSTLCAAELCTPPPSFKACSIHNGTVDCPAGAPNKHVIGSDFNSTCANCTCSFNATCGGVLTVYSNSNCTGTSKSLNANTCTAMSSFGMNSTKWVGSVNATCTNNAAPAPTITWVGAKTVCCP